MRTFPGRRQLMRGELWVLLVCASACSCWQSACGAVGLRGGSGAARSSHSPAVMVDGEMRFKRNPVTGVLGYLQLLPRKTGCVVLNAAPSVATSGGGVAAPSGTDVATAMRSSITALYAQFVSVDGDGVDYTGLRGSEAFKEYVALSGQLVHLDPLSMDRNERLAFFINVYNSLTIHSVAALGAPADLLSRLRLYAEASYQIGPHTYSLNDIENGILRGNRPPPTVNPFPRKPFPDSDPRMQLACRDVDARIHFALNCAAKSCPVS